MLPLVNYYNIVIKRPRPTKQPKDRFTPLKINLNQSCGHRVYILPGRNLFFFFFFRSTILTFSDKAARSDFVFSFPVKLVRSSLFYRRGIWVSRVGQ